MSRLPEFQRPMMKPLNSLTLALTMTVLLMASVFTMGGCAASGPKYIHLLYSGTPDSGTGTLGIARFEDARQDKGKGELGYRLLNDKSKEVFLVQGLDLAASLTNQTQTFLEKKGITVLPAPPWTPDLEGLANAQTEEDQLLTARINAFEMKAEKKGGMTEMVLTIDLTFFLGKKSENKLTTIPVSLSLERTEINFTLEKVESFFNQALAEALEKALVLN